MMRIDITNLSEHTKFELRRLNDDDGNAEAFFIEATDTAAYHGVGRKILSVMLTPAQFHQLLHDMPCLDN